MKKEIWKKVPGYDIYEASTHGRIKNIDFHGTGIQRIRSFKKKNSGGYYKLIMCHNGTRNHTTVHQVIAKTFLPNPENKPFINHIDGNKVNNMVENLEWCTHIENMNHAKENCLNPYGSKHGMSKIDESIVRMIKKELHNGLLNQKQIAIKFNVKHATVNHIKTGRQWGHVK